MDFTNHELRLLGQVQRILNLHQRKVTTSRELVNGLIDEIAHAEADRVIPHCLALLPGEARSHIEACLAELEASNFRDGLGFSIGPGPPEQKRAWLRERYRAIAVQVVEYYRQYGDRTEPPIELVVPTVDRFWELLRGMPSEGGAKCRADGCDEPPVRVSVFCARHHYENIERRPPPDY